MKTMKWLLRREFWEHKGAMFWAPVVAAALMIVFIGGGVLYGAALKGLPGEITHNGRTTTVHALGESIPAAKIAEVSSVVANHYLAPAAPLFIMGAFIAFFYCLGALHDERRDRSILFWKSLPVSDTETVLSKVITAILVAPLIVMAVAVLTSLLLLLIGGLVMAFNGLNMFGPVLSTADFYLTPLRLVALLPVYVLFALPTVGWLLMVSAWAKSKVFLWAVGTPVITMIAVKWLDHLLGLGIDMHGFVNNVLMRGLVGLFPGSWFLLSQVHPNTMLDENHTMTTAAILRESYMTLAAPGVWIAAAVGVAMIYAAIRLRRWKDEG